MRKVIVTIEYEKAQAMNRLADSIEKALEFFINRKYEYEVIEMNFCPKCAKDYTAVVFEGGTEGIMAICPECGFMEINNETNEI